MTIALKGNAQGGVIIAGGTPAENVTQATGIPFMKNKLINGEVTRVNQRGVANWAAVANGAYGYDRWKKIDASNMTQIIEAGNFRPNTVHTLSGIGVTTQQITSPAGGNWTLPNIPIAATNVQVEEGLEATPFEVRHMAFEMALCLRYYEIIGMLSGIAATATEIHGSGAFAVPKRAVPALVFRSGTEMGVRRFAANVTAYTSVATLPDVTINLERIVYAHVGGFSGLVVGEAVGLSGSFLAASAEIP